MRTSGLGGGIVRGVVSTSAHHHLSKQCNGARGRGHLQQDDHNDTANEVAAASVTVDKSLNQTCFFPLSLFVQ